MQHLTIGWSVAPWGNSAIMQNLIIVGAGGIGTQIADMVDELNKYSKDWNLLGFLDDDESKQGISVAGYPVLGKIEDAHGFEDCSFILAVGNSKNYYIRKVILKKLGFDVKRYATIIHPDATVSKHSAIGCGSVVLAGARVMPNTRIGDHTLVLANSYIGHDCIIQDFVTVTNSACICGMTTIEDGCYVGANSSIRERIVVRKWSLIGLGAVVLEDVAPFSVIVGNPGTVIRTQDSLTFDVR